MSTAWGTSFWSQRYGEWNGSSYTTSATADLTTATAYNATGQVISQTDRRGNTTYLLGIGKTHGRVKLLLDIDRVLESANLFNR